MPIIKDKYGAKSKSIRSKYVTRKVDKAIYTDSLINTNINTGQKKSLEVESIRSADAKEHSQSIVDINNRPAIIKGVKLSIVNQVENIFTLSKGQSLKDIIISHFGSDSALVSIHWSTTSIQDLSFDTVSSGRITATTGGVTFRLFSDTFTIDSQISLGSNFMLDTFTNVNKDLYFYGVTSLRGPEITIVKC